MEIEFNNVTYKENVHTPLEITYLKGVSFKIEEGKIYSIIGDTKSGIEVIGSLINAEKKPSKGHIRIGNIINDRKFIKKINRLRKNVSFIKNDNTFICKTVKEELEYGLKRFNYKKNNNHLRSIDTLTLVNLKEDYLNKKISDLTISERKKIKIASYLITNPKVLIIEEAFMFLINKDKDDLKRLINILTNRYNKTVVLITKDTDISYELSDKVIIFNDGKIVKEGDKNILLNDFRIYNVANPKIVEFIKEANKHNANLTYTNNILDLIKEVYRNV